MKCARSTSLSIDLEATVGDEEDEDNDGASAGVHTVSQSKLTIY